MTTAADVYPAASQYAVNYWGYPFHGPRRIKPTILLVIHITGNSNLPNALGEATYSNRDGSTASFTFVTNRDGSIVQCLHPLTQTPWTNGDVMSPNMSIPTVAAACNGNPYNMNEFCFMTCENVGYPVSYEITTAQKETLAQLAAWGSKVSGLPVNRNTVLGHRDINSVTRHNCPTAGDLDALIAGIVKRANEILSASTGLPDTATTGGTEDLSWLNDMVPAEGIIHFTTGDAIYDAPGHIIAHAPGASSANKIATLQAGGVWYHVYLLAAGGLRLVRISETGNADPLPVPVADCSAQVKSATDPLNAQISALQGKIAKAKSDLA